MFEIGEVYNRRREIHEKFGGQQQGGISTPSDKPFIFLFTGERGEDYGYKDGWNDEGIFLYTGEGQLGDMEFVRGNLAIRDHSETGKALHVFKNIGKGQCEYVGEFICSSWEWRIGSDYTGNKRKIIVFHLTEEKQL